ncbi:MAG: mechanosensitive ion channel family protein, partial [Fusobacterium varium]|nr:mechanosensitive ion channel family protein [Fusobacterium varium]
MLKLLESWGEEILKILPETILRILWVIFLVSIMKYVVKISAHALKVLMEKSNADELLISF